MLVHLIAAIRLWARRAATRRELRALEAWQLADIGRSRREHAQECAKWFWQG